MSYDPLDDRLFGEHEEGGSMTDQEPTEGKHTFKTYVEYRQFLDRLPDNTHYTTECDKKAGVYIVETIK